MIMPGGNGVDLACRFLDRHPKARAVIISGYADSETGRLAEAESMAARQTQGGEESKNQSSTVIRDFLMQKQQRALAARHHGHRRTVVVTVTGE